MYNNKNVAVLNVSSLSTACTESLHIIILISAGSEKPYISLLKMLALLVNKLACYKLSYKKSCMHCIVKVKG